MSGDYHVFLSHSRNDPEATAEIARQLRRSGLDVFKDDESILPGDAWLARLQSVLDGCGAFVVLVGRDGVRRWVGAETQAALNRHFGPHDDGQRLPIFPILLDDATPEQLPPLLGLFQVTHWNPGDALKSELLAAIRDRNILRKVEPIAGCPFVGLASFRRDQAHLFFGRQKETLDALACFEARGGRAPVRWLEINGNSGSGKSSLMYAGLLPLIEDGWLWPRTGYERWQIIGPMMPGAHPLGMLAESLARAWDAEMAEVSARLKADGEDTLACWLRSRKQDGTAFLLAIDQFEELFTFADADERRRFDVLLAAALDDPDCPLFVLSTVRSDFLDRFVETLPRLTAVQNRVGRSWKLGPIGIDGLGEVIDGPARLAGLDVSEVRELILAEAQDEPGALPLVENALHWLWRKRRGDTLSGRLLREHGGLAGLLSQGADNLLAGLGPQRDRALELLFALINVDMDTRRHTRRRLPFKDAVAWAGGGAQGRAIVDRLAGQRRPDGAPAAGPLRLITITGNTGNGEGATGGAQVSLIHETLIRSTGAAAGGKPQPYWPTLWTYIEANAERAARRERLKLMARVWQQNKGFARFWKLAGWSSLFGFRGAAAPGSLEQRYLGWSRVRAVVEAGALIATLAVIGESVSWAMTRGVPPAAIIERWGYTLGLAKPPLPALVEIPAGSFRMGSERNNDAKSVHAVRFAQPFLLGATEVTFREWDACVADGGCDYRPADQGWGRETRPVINVSWQDAQAYVAWVSAELHATCRLPSEAEWEYAARAGTRTEYALPAPDGSDDIGGKGLANCDGCGSEWDNRQTAPVTGAGRFQPNAWGVYDMHGNVWEWVEDCWHGDFSGAPDDGGAWRSEDGDDCPSRVLRGGSWYDSRVFARSASRFGSRPYDRLNLIGFRVVCLSPIFGH